MNVIIASYKGSPFLQGCLDSIPADLSCIVIRNDGYECGALRMAQKIEVDEFFFMQDSARIKDPTWLYRILADKGVSYCVNNETGPLSMYTGKLRQSVLRQIDLPVTKTKMDAVLFELAFGYAYSNLDPVQVLWPELCLDNAQDGEIFGRPVKIYENDHFLKYKGTWNAAMIPETCSRDQELRALHAT